MIPDFQSIMLPALQCFKNHENLTSKEIRERMVTHFKISEEEKKEMIPSGRQRLYYNRIAWAITYLKMGELISSPERAKYQITDLGKKVLENPPDKISIKFLKTLPNFEKNRRPEKQKNEVSENDDDEILDKTPDELLEIGFKQINNDLANVIMEYIKKSSFYFFEQLVIDLLLNMGYGASDFESGEVTSKGSDEGIDGIIKEDKLGLDKIYIQAKKWENTVGRPEIQKFVGALQGKRAKKGIFITTSNFSKDAKEYIKNLDVSVVLIDGIKLIELMIEFDLGVSIKNIYKLKKIDTDYFNEE